MVAVLGVPRPLRLGATKAAMVRRAETGWTFLQREARLGLEPEVMGIAGMLDTGETSITNSGPLRVRKIKLEKINVTRHVHVPIGICHLTETATRHVWKDVDIEYRHTDLKESERERERETDRERKSLPTPSKHNQTKQTLCA